MKNLTVYKLDDNWTPYQGELHTIPDFVEAIELHGFAPCATLQTSSIGFIDNPFGDAVTFQPDATILTVRRQDKKPKPAHVKHLTNEKVERIKDLEGRPVGKKELTDLKHEAMLEIIPKTFPDDPVDTNIIIADGFVYVDAVAKKAEVVLNLLREVVGSLPITPVLPENINIKMGTMLKQAPPEPFTLAHDISMEDCDARKITIKGNLYGSDAQELAEEGHTVTGIGLTYDEVVTFQLKDTMEISGIKYDSSLGCKGESEEDASGTFTLQYRNLLMMYKSLLRGLNYGND